MANNNNRNRVEIPGAKGALQNLKLEVARELGIPEYDQIDKGDLPARVHGKVGGNMVRKMIAAAEQMMAQNDQAIQFVESQHGANQQDIQTVQSYSQTNTTDLH